MRLPALLSLLLIVVIASCEKNKVSKIPQISLTGFGPDSVYISAGAQDSIAAMEFSFIDGDGDIGVDSSSSAIFVKDSRFDTTGNPDDGFVKYPFPASIDKSIEDPKKGLTGTCLFVFAGNQQLSLRSDSVHQAQGDTAFFTVYITDRARNKSNKIVTPRLIMYP